MSLANRYHFKAVVIYDKIIPANSLREGIQILMSRIELKDWHKFVGEFSHAWYQDTGDIVVRKENYDSKTFKDSKIIAVSHYDEEVDIATCEMRMRSK